jgi:hypothetical protein
MDSKKNNLLLLMQIPVRNCGVHPKFSHDVFSLFFNFSSLSFRTQLYCVPTNILEHGRTRVPAGKGRDHAHPIAIGLHQIF